jgi:uncharacterized membrane protein YkvA (DUF1232 family)
MTPMQRLRELAGRLKRDVMTLWFAWRDPATPWAARLLIAGVVGYALSPIDLIPDFVPVLGLLDDLILLPLLIWLALRLLPPDVLAASRARAQAWQAEQLARPRSIAGAAVIVLLWFAALLLIAGWLWPWA